MNKFIVERTRTYMQTDKVQCSGCNKEVDAVVVMSEPDKWSYGYRSSFCKSCLRKGLEKLGG